jgi:outer membrane receptor protein involved in Fe transport
MKTLYLVFLSIWACFAFTVAKAQAPRTAISGLVFDEAKKPVDGATVILANAVDSATVKTVLTNADGSFAFADVREGNYRIVVTSVGYRKYKGAVFSFKGQLIGLGGITLSGTTKALKEVEVAAPKAFVEQKIDRTVVNVNALISNTGANALEALEKAPGVIVDQDGNISFKGKSNVLIMIDDKPTYLSGDNLAAYLKSLPASMLDQIELMSNPPAKYDASGNAGVINIKTKKSKAAGFNGTFSSSVGRAVFWRTLNSLNLNYHVNKVNLFANLGYGIGNNYRRLDVVRTYMDNLDHITSSYTEEAYFHPVSYNHNLKTGMDYYVTPKTTVGFVLTGALTEAHNANPVYSKQADGAGQIDSNIIANNYTQSRFLNGGINLNYSHQFDRKGRSLTFDLDYLRYDSGRDQTFYNTSYNSAGAVGSIQNIADNLPTGINIYTAKTDYTQPVKGKGKIEAGLKTGYVSTDNAANYYNVVSNVNVVDNNRTNRFLYNENINAAYFSYDNEFKRFAVKAGLRAENTNVKAHQLGNAFGSDSSFTQQYLSLFPTAYLLYKLDTAGAHTLKLSYGRRISRPNYQDLNPFVTILDKYSAFEGNPFLKPQYSTEYELAYAYKSVFVVTVEYNPIRDYQVELDYMAAGGIFTATSANLPLRNHWGVTANIALSPAKRWNFNYYNEVMYNAYSGQVGNIKLSSSSVYYYLNCTNQFNLSRGWNVEMNTFYLTPSRDAQFTHRYREQTNVGISKKILNNKATVKLSARDIFVDNFSAGNITNVPNAAITYHNNNGNRSVTLGFTYNFGSNKDNPKRRDTGGAASEAGRVGN